MQVTLAALLVAIACVSCMAAEHDNDLAINNMIGLLSNSGCVNSDNEADYREKLRGIKDGITKPGKFVIGSVMCKSFQNGGIHKKMKTACRCESLELTEAKEATDMKPEGEKDGSDGGIISGIPSSRHGKSEERYHIIIEGEQKDNLIHCGYYLATLVGTDFHSVPMECIAPKNDDSSDVEEKDDSSDVEEKDDSSDVEGKDASSDVEEKGDSSDAEGDTKSQSAIKRQARRERRRNKRQARRERRRRKRQARRKLLQTSSCTS